MFLLVPAYPGCPGSKAVKRSLLLLLLSVGDMDVNTRPVHGSRMGVDICSKAVGVDELLLAVTQKLAAHDRKFDSSVQWRLH